jgi:hypothetical protein
MCEFNKKSFDFMNIKVAVQYISSWLVWFVMLGCSLVYQVQSCVRARARVCISAYIYCGRCIKSAFTEEKGNIKRFMIKM